MKKFLALIISLSILFTLLAPLPAFSVETAYAGENSTVFMPSSWDELGEGGSLWSQLAPSSTIDVSNLPESGGLIVIPDTVTSVKIAGNGKIFTDTAIKTVGSCAVTLTDIAVNAPSGSSAFEAIGTSSLEITGLVSLTGSETFPAVSVPADSQLTLFGRGELTATAGNLAAAIGGGSTYDAGTIILDNLKVTANASNGGAGIGSGFSRSFSKISIYGGTINCTGGQGAAGIGGGDTAKNGVISITGGNITSTGGTGAAGIGGGRSHQGLKIYISNGNITADGGVQGAGIGAGSMINIDLINISGGTIKASGGQHGAGIGGGYRSSVNTIVISGGTINSSSNEGGAGIGGGAYGACGVIKITEGTIHSTGGQYGAGIGAGSNEGGGTITIYKAAVTATGANGAAGIGGGYGGGGANTTIYSGEVTATGGLFGAGIGGGYGGSGNSIKISGGIVNATGDNGAAGIGGGYGEGGTSLHIDGGIVTAKGGDGAAGIGGGLNGMGGTITIEGGSTTATGGLGSSDIGHGAEHDVGGNIYISSGSLVGSVSSHTDIFNSDVSRTPVYPVSLYCYDINDSSSAIPDATIRTGTYLASTNSSGMATIYLPSGSASIEAYIAGMESDTAEVSVSQGSPSSTVELPFKHLDAPSISSENSFICGSDGGTFQIEASGGKGQTFSISGDYPRGCTIGEQSGILTVLSDVAPGIYSFTVNVSNTVSPDAAQNFTLTVNDTAAPAIGAPEFSPESYTNSYVTVTFPVEDFSEIEVELSYGGSPYEISRNEDGTYSFIAYANGVYTVSSSDEFGNESSLDVTVSNIDIDNPVISTVSYDNTPTNAGTQVEIDVTDSSPSKVWIIDESNSVVAASDNGENKFSATIAENGSYRIVAADKGAHFAYSEFDVTNIYKSAPAVSSASCSVTDTSVTLTATVQNDTAPSDISYTYQWQAMSENGFVNIDGATLPEDTYNTEEPSDTYRLIVTDNYGNSSSLDILPGQTVNGGGSPENAQPSSTALNVSDINVEYLDDKSVALSVSAYGGSDLSYAWSYATSGAEISASGGDLIADGSSQSSAYTPMGDTGIVYFTALSPESDYHIKLFVQTVKVNLS